MQKLPAFGRSPGRSVSKGSRDSSGSTTEQVAAMDSEPAAPPASKGGMFGMAVGVWRKATSKLFDLEAKIANQVGTLRVRSTKFLHYYPCQHPCNMSYKQLSNASLQPGPTLATLQGATELYLRRVSQKTQPTCMIPQCLSFPKLTCHAEPLSPLSSANLTTA